jgi:hypothetical protein
MAVKVSGRPPVDLAGGRDQRPAQLQSLLRRDRIGGVELVKPRLSLSLSRVAGHPLV